ncbi:hypothetical protein [Frankia sp. KB5]|uniref:hypothetical protein n=1 Tax=Frankia sp. KB5 TaxID=683318 RepID=UPI0026A5D471
MTDNGGAHRRSGRRWLWIIAGIAAAGAVGAVVGIWHLPDRMYEGEEARAALQGGLLTAAAALMAVAGGLIALDETRRANANTHVRELYATAISQLGADSLDIRLGGIYALERIAHDSAADQRTVVEVLSAFIREHTQPPTPHPHGDHHPGPRPTYRPPSPSWVACPPAPASPAPTSPTLTSPAPTWTGRPSPAPGWVGRPSPAPGWVGRTSPTRTSPTPSWTGRTSPTL